jgi:glycosyltransferase involved in cell wall biosynthesis
MNNFWNNIILPIIEGIDVNYIIEVGSDTGLNTQNILDYCMKHNARMTAIDPIPKFDIDEFKHKYGNKFEIYKELSLSRLPLLNDYDVILLDGDHNWYTVYNELKIIEKTFKNKKNFPLIFVHDVGWPYARRDLYYNPENIPKDYRQPYKKLGMYPDKSNLKEQGGLNPHLNNAIYEKNPKNGIMTAIENFIDESDFKLSFEFINAFFGLGILYITNNKIEKIVKNVIKSANLLDILEEKRIKSAIVYSELKSLIDSLEKKLNEEKSKRKEVENRLNELKMKNNSLEKKVNEEQIKLKHKEYKLKSYKKQEEQINELNLQIDTLKESFYKMRYLNNIGRSLTQRLISKFPKLYILLNSENALENINGYNIIKRNNLFDEGYYLKKYPDVRLSGMDPLIHYVCHGFKEGKRPNSTFSQNNYLQIHDDINLNPLVHYSLYGIKPKISIITASYNYAHIIKKAINSVISQTYNNWELIIIDDGSTDNSLEVINEYTKNPKVKLYQHEGGVNKGLKETVLLGLKHSTGDYVAFLEADDWLEDNYLEEKVMVLAQHPDLKFIFNDVALFSNQKDFDFSWYTSYLKSQKKIIRNSKMPSDFSKYFTKHNFIPTFSCVFVEKDLLLSCNFDTPKDPILDYWIFKQLASKTDFYYIDKKLTHWMMHKKSYINKIFSPNNDFAGFERAVVDVTEFFNSLYDNNPNINSDEYVKKSNRYFQRQEKDVKLIAFYLPQFHVIKENDEWWGKGFTEWNNVTKAQPQFLGHYQPQLPDELGFYDLSDQNVMNKQVEMAKKYGIYGFCFHYYWFSGKRLLEKPIFDFLNNKDLNFNFMLCWANESWTRTWTHFEGETLINQQLEEEDYLKFIQDIMPFFKDDRYIKIDNKPVFIVYRPKTFPKEKLKAAIKIWRDYAKKQGFDDLHILNTKTDLFRDHPSSWDINGTVQFPPNDMVKKYQNEEELKILNPNFNGKVFNLPKSIEETESSSNVDYMMYKCVFPSWDNTARKNDSGSIYYGSSPKLYKKWLFNSIKFTKENLDKKHHFVFVNAWNEWAEGCHLEPDKKYGFAYLEATLDTLEKSRSMEKAKIKNKLINSNQIISDNGTFPEKPLKITFIVTEMGLNAAAGDYFTALELGEALKELGFEIEFLARNPRDYYYVGEDVDFIISMLHDFDPRKIISSNKSLVKIAWARNWFDGWVKQPYFQDFDIVFASSKVGCEFINDKNGKETVLLPIATNPSRFNDNISQRDEYLCDYCFTGSYWNDPRDIIEMLDPDDIPFDFKLFGKNWDKISKFKKYNNGFITYFNLPEVYASTKIVIDDANRVTKNFGAVNSRVYDALACGALVFTNGEIGAEETFSGKLPIFKSKDDLKDLITYYLNNEDKRLSKVKELQKYVLENHTYKNRANRLKEVIGEHISKLVLKEY